MSSVPTRKQEAKPNFSGKWRLLPESGAPAVPAPLVLRPDLTITQTTVALTVEQPGGMGGSVTITYKLDGSETRQVINRAEVVTKAWWDGETLVTTVRGETANWNDAWTFAGPRLVIATTAPGRTILSTRTYEKL